MVSARDETKRDDVGVRATMMKVTKTMSSSTMPSSDAPSRPVSVTRGVVDSRFDAFQLSFRCI
jgi:hypothetical protein